ncbi:MULTISPECIES: two-component system sensor histidine kinase NtrB [Cohnella]|uniref:two-component system sensor histidine kinase NtrB n=1 Tax=Cohnella TaxID=329857 RepID=UPI0009B9AD2E|nr:MULTISPECIES: ATP-binding protein [Cohnella]MBN2981451.1 PAS domain-containing sensor histidine kinase [Cohnella algarum]
MVNSGLNGDSAHRDPAASGRDIYIYKFAERILEDDHTGVVLCDSGFRILEISPMVCSVFGGERKGIIGQSVWTWLAGLPSLAPAFWADLLEGRSFRNRRFTWGNGEGRRELTLEGGTLRDGGAAIGSYLLFQDVTHLMQLEEQVRRSDRLKMIGQVAAGTAHEIRNPLTAIKGFMQLLGKALAERDMNRELEYVGIVLSELDRVNSLVNEFLLLSKPKEVRLVPVYLGALFGEMLPMLHSDAILYDVNLNYEPADNLPPVYADKEMLKQVFLNLGKNAIEAMGTGGTLVIKERGPLPGGREVSVEIRDNGPGIAEELLERVFDPFFTTKEQGTGLGLSICQRIVHELGGRIGVKSGPGGTTFTVSLPMAAFARGKKVSGGGALPFHDV